MHGVDEWTLYDERKDWGWNAKSWLALHVLLRSPICVNAL
jgi:hypothetical protein